MLLDTNVVSEVLRTDPSPRVIGWIRKQRLQTIYLAAPSLAELLVGIEAMPHGRRKLRLVTALNRFVASRLADRVLSFDEAAATAYATLVVHARQLGRAISVVDGQIAAIALIHGLTVVTRDVSPFEAAGLPIINPWDPGVPHN